MDEPTVTVVGGGLAGSECAFQLARRGIPVRLCEMKPLKRSAAHKSDHLAELVCSNSFRSDDPNTAIGLLHAELRAVGSIILCCADEHRVPAGGALAVDRERFSEAVTASLSTADRIERVAAEVQAVPEGLTVVATGPLTTEGLSADLERHVGEKLYFYDAIAPIVSADSIESGLVFRQSRYDKGGGDDYLNLPMTQEEYRSFVQELRGGQKLDPHPFEEPKYFEGCLPIEVMAERGEDVLRHGPMKPVGLTDPRTGKSPYAVVQLRKEDRGGTSYNLVGFQTRLTWPEQRRIFQRLPGLAAAEFLRMGQIHRNTFIDAPRLLNADLSLKTEPRIFFAGQITGVEGYLESTACGYLAALSVEARIRGKAFVPPPATTAMGALYRHVTGEAHPDGYEYQPTNVIFGLFPPLTGRIKRAQRREHYAKRAIADFGRWLAPAALLLLVFLSGCGKQAAPADGRDAGASTSRLIHQGPIADLRASPDQRRVAFISDAEKPRLLGVPPQMRIGRLSVASVSDGKVRPLGEGVTNMPGGYAFGPDGRWIFFLSGYDAARQEGRLLAADLAEDASPVLELGRAVTYFTVSPGSRYLAFVDGGLLKAGPIGKGPFVDVAAGVTTAQFSPDAQWLLFKRSVSGLSALLLTKVGGWKDIQKLGERVGDYAISPDSAHVAFDRLSGGPGGERDLYLASRPRWVSEKLASAVGEGFAFSPDAKLLARTEGKRPGRFGDLFVGPASGGKGRRIGDRVEELAFSPDSSAIAYLELYDLPSRTGVIGMASMPNGVPHRLGSRVPNFTWGPEGKSIAFLSRFLKPAPSVDLMLYPQGAKEAVKVRQGVFGYGFAHRSPVLLLRSNCIREGRGCDLFEVDASASNPSARKLIEGIFSFKLSLDDRRVLLSRARLDGEDFDLLVLDRSTANAAEIDERAQLPAWFVADDGSKAVHRVVTGQDRAGLYLDGPFPLP